MWSNFTTMLGWGHYDIYEPNYRLGNEITSKLVFKNWYDFNLCRFLVISGVCTRAGWNNIKAGLGRGGQNKLCVWTTWCVGFWLIMQYKVSPFWVFWVPRYIRFIYGLTPYIYISSSIGTLGLFVAEPEKAEAPSQSLRYTIYILYLS